ncbi:MAG: DUF6519 domain-containing protein [Acidobacteriota bacterium]
MKADFTRSTFRSSNHYSSVRFRQGSVILDAEINEEADILAHVERTTNIDTIGGCGAPYHEPGTFRNFLVKIDQNGKDLLIAPGRIYVDGILCENEADKGVSFTQQTDLPGAKLPDQAGNHVVYLDVWERLITSVDQYGEAFPLIRETALAGPETALRSRVVWQVKVAPVSGNTCDAWAAPSQSTGRMRAAAEPSATATNDCLVPEGGGYRRLENQLYRVEVHESTDDANPRFKWSRDNASITSKIKASDQVASVITVEDPGRDEILGFASAKWVELTDEERVLNNQAGLLLEVDTVTGTSIKVENPTNAALAGGTNPVIRRWDGVNKLAPGTVTAIEDGVEIEFDTGTLATGDYWMFPARTLTGRVEWPGDGTQFEARHGTIHHYCPLAVVNLAGGLFTGTPSDCRKLFPPLTAIKASDVSYNPAACANLAGADTVQKALDKLCQSTGSSEKGIHIKGVRMVSGSALQNDTLVSAASLAEGIRIVCDAALFPQSVRNAKGRPNPVCLLTLELPWPLNSLDRQLWRVGNMEVLGFQTITVAGEVTVEENEIIWTATGEAKRWLVDLLLQVVGSQTQTQMKRVLARLTLKGNFIWGGEDPRLYLDGEVFGVPASGGTRIDLPSGNGGRGGDFEMWFWVSETVRVPPIGVIAGRASGFFQTPSGAQAIAFSIDRRAETLGRLLPDGYVVDAAQEFDPAKAVRFARDTGVRAMTMLTGEGMGRVSREIVRFITTNAQVRVEITAVPDGELVAAVRSAAAAGSAPDFVVGTEEQATQLAQIGFTNSPMIRI